MEVAKNIRTYNAQRVLLTSPKPLKEVMKALGEELNMNNTGQELARRLSSAHSKEELEGVINSLTEGKRDFL